MHEVIQQLVAVETEAHQIVQSAHVEADRILAETQLQAQELLASGREEARLAAENLLATAIAEAERDKQSRLTEASEKINAEIHLNEEAARQIVREIVRCITCGH